MEEYRLTDKDQEALDDAMRELLIKEFLELRGPPYFVIKRENGKSKLKDIVSQ